MVTEITIRTNKFLLLESLRNRFGEIVRRESKNKENLGDLESSREIDMRYQLVDCAANSD